MAHVPLSPTPDASLDDPYEFIAEVRKSLTGVEHGTITLESCMLGLCEAEEVLKSTPDGQEIRWRRLAEVGFWKHALFISHSHDIKHLDEAIRMVIEADTTIHAATALTDNNLRGISVNRAITAFQLASYYFERSKWTCDAKDLSKALNQYERVEFQSTIGSEHIHSRALNALHFASRKGEADCWNRMYQVDSRVAALKPAIEAYEEALLHTPGDVSLVRDLAQCLQNRWVRERRPEDLDYSIEALTSLSSKNAMVLGELSRNLGYRYTERGQKDDLDTSITLGYRAVQQLASSYSSFGVQSLNVKAWLSDSLNLRFHFARDVQDLEQAIQLSRESVETSVQDLEQAQRLCSYADRLGTRFDIQGEGGDLQTATRCLDTALDLATDTTMNAWAANQTSAKIRACLSVMHLRRYNTTGVIEDLCQGIEAIVSYPIKMYACLQDGTWALAMGIAKLLARYSDTRVLEHLDQAIKAAQIALETLALNDGRRPTFLGLLSHCYHLRTAEVQSTEDLDKVIDVTLQALNQNQASDSLKQHRFAYLAGVAESLYRRSVILWEQSVFGNYEEDSTKAIEYAIEARSECQKGSPNLANAIILLAKCFKSRFTQLDDPDLGDIDQAIGYFQQALTLAGVKSDATRTQELLFEIALAYSLRATAPTRNKQEDEGKALQMFRMCADTLTCPPRKRVLASIRVAEHYSSSGQWAEAVQAWRKTLDLVPTLNLRLQSQRDRVDFLHHLAGVSRRASSAALNAGVDATEAMRLLELGRGLTAGFILEARVDIDKLSPSEASNFERARLRVESLRRSTKVGKMVLEESEMAQWVSDFVDYNEAKKTLESTIAGIEANQKTNDFLGPPSLDEVRKYLGGNDTIIEINTSSERCDAFVIQKNYEHVKSVRLEDLIFDDIEEWLGRLKSSRPLIDLGMLEWLWDTVAHPILEYLGFGPQAASSNSPSFPRIIWIMTGSLSHFPIHAAGIYGGSSTLMDHAISSYSFSLRAFVFGHMWESKNTFRVPDDDMLLVGMGKTPGLRNLPFAIQEIGKLATMAPDIGRGLVCLSEPRRDVVLDELSKCDIFHFAGHGISDPLRPLNSGLVLQDGHLTISDLLEYRIAGHGKDPPFLAFLSACLTGTNDFENLVDEGIHLISAFQLVGFEHVIGTLWQVDDETCLKVTEGVYSEMARRLTDEFFDEDDDGAVCRGLHNAVVAMRDEWMREQHEDMSLPHRNRQSMEIKGQGGGQEGNEADDVGKEEEYLTMQMRSLQIRLARARLRGERNVQFITTEPKAGNLVKADWIPFVHYGILRGAMAED